LVPSYAGAGSAEIDSDLPVFGAGIGKRPSVFDGFGAEKVGNSAASVFQNQRHIIEAQSDNLSRVERCQLLGTASAVDAALLPRRRPKQPQ
jgi:hypothetical protein